MFVEIKLISSDEGKYFYLEYRKRYIANGPICYCASDFSTIKYYLQIPNNELKNIIKKNNGILFGKEIERMTFYSRKDATKAIDDINAILILRELLN